MTRWLRALRLLAGAGFVVGLISAGLVVLIVWGPPGPQPPATPIRIENGLLQGVRGDGVTIYRGIPFAAPPLGDLRWRAPQLAASWQGTLRAYRFKPVCMQEGATVPGLALEPMSEDCLYLNV